MRIVDFHRINCDSVIKSVRSNSQFGFELGNSGVNGGMWRIEHGRLGLRLIRVWRISVMELVEPLCGVVVCLSSPG
jgi:hypothetical protein